MTNLFFFFFFDRKVIRGVVEPYSPQEVAIEQNDAHAKIKDFCFLRGLQNKNPSWDKVVTMKRLD